MSNRLEYFSALLLDQICHLYMKKSEAILSIKLTALLKSA
jgi:hypothetical protein